MGGFLRNKGVLCHTCPCCHSWRAGLATVMRRLWENLFFCFFVFMSRPHCQLKLSLLGDFWLFFPSSSLKDEIHLYNSEFQFDQFGCNQYNLAWNCYLERVKGPMQLWGSKNCFSTEQIESSGRYWLDVHPRNNDLSLCHCWKGPKAVQSSLKIYSLTAIWK